MKKVDLNKLLTIVTTVMVAIAVVLIVIWYNMYRNVSVNLMPDNSDYNSDRGSVELDDTNNDGITIDDIFDDRIGYGETIENAELWYSLNASEDVEPTSQSINGVYSKLIRDINKKASEDRRDNSNNDPSRNQQNPDDALSGALDDLLGNIGKDSPEVPNIGNDSDQYDNGTDGNTDDNANNNPTVPNVNIELNNEIIDSRGKVKEGKFNLYDYVSKDIPIVNGNNLTGKVFGELDKLTNKFVVVTNKDTNVENIINSIINNYKNKLLIDKINYGRISEYDNNHYLFEIEYLVTNKQMEELKKYATGVAEEAKKRKDKKQLEYVAQVISDLGDYSENGANIYSPYSLYKDKKGVCQAYTSMAKIILDEMGVDNGIATGTIDGVPHTWNVVKYEGKWYHFDFTLTDTKKEKSKYLFVESFSNIKDNRVVDNIIR